MALFEPQNQIPGAPPNLPVPKPSTPPPPPPPMTPNAPGASRPSTPPPLPHRSMPSMPSMPPSAPSKTSEPEDIFSGTGASKGGAQPPRPSETLGLIDQSPSNGSGSKLIRLLLIALGAAAIVTAGYFGYNYIMGDKTQPSLLENENLNLPVEEGNENANVNVNAPEINENVPLVVPPLENNTNPPPAIDMSADTDKDGLSDYEEKNIYYTNPLVVDTDNDGLTDRDELMIWKTDPLNHDTDGDSYSDGSEVQNQYNPLGPGKLVPPINP